MKKTLTAKLLTLLMALVLMVTAIPMGNVTAEAAVKPGAVSSVKVSKITEKSAKVTYKKAKKAKGYQIRVYKGKKQVFNKKTKALSYTVKKLQANTKYTVKVRAYNGKKYGKEKTVKFRTKKPANTPAPTNETEEPSSEEPNSGIVMPGESTSTGDALIAEYNAYVAYEAEQWKNSQVTYTNPQTEFDVPWYGAYVHTPMMFQYNAAYNDKYSLFKYKAGTPNAIADFFVDVFNAFGLPAERYYNMLDDVDKYVIDIDVNETAAAFIYTFNGRQIVDAYGTDFQVRGNRAGYDLSYYKAQGEKYTFAAKCPDCGKEMKIYIPKSLMASTLPTTLNGQTVNFNCSCSQYTKVYKFKLPYTVNDLATMPWITELTELVATTD